MRLSSALHFLVAAVTLAGSPASQPKGGQSIALAAVTEARDELKIVVQQLGQQQEQINELTKEVNELRNAKKSSPPATVSPNSNTSVAVASNQGPSNKTGGPRKVLTSLRATAERAEHVLVEARPRTPWWAEKQHTKGPVDMHREGGYYGETNSDPTFGRHRYYPAGWSLAPEHQPIQAYGATDGVTSYNVFAPGMVAAPPAPSPFDSANDQADVFDPTLPPVAGETPQAELPTSAAAANAPPPPGGNELRPKSDQLTGVAQGKSMPLKNTMGFFGPPPSGQLPNAPASA